jgi:FAD/FMN-containing dehydrogenase
MGHIELAEAIRTSSGVFTDSCAAPFGFPSSGTALSLESETGIVEFSPADQVVVVGAGTRLSQLNEELAANGQGIPHFFSVDLGDPMLHQLIGAGLPHAGEGRFGTWRDWVLGFKLLQADGTIVKCGSKAVKNVAGYDVQRLMIGTRGTLAITLEVILRTSPIAAWPPPRDPVSHAGEVWIQRTLATDLDSARQDRSDLLAVDEDTATLWSTARPERRFAQDWLIGPGQLPDVPPTLRPFYQRAKSEFDPENKLNPGAMGDLF